MTGRHTVIVLITLGLALSHGAVSTAGQEKDVSASDILKQGLEQFQNGKTDQARQLLIQIDPAQLTAQERVAWRATLKSIRDTQSLVAQGNQPAPEAAAQQEAPAQAAQPEPAKEAAPEAAPAAQTKAPEAAPKPEPKAEVAVPAAPAAKAATGKAPTTGKAAAGNGQELMSRAVKLRAQQLIAQAEQAEKDGQYNKAIELYSRALEVETDNEQARKGLETVRALMGRGEGRPLIEGIADVVKLRSEQAKARYSSSMEQAVRARDGGNFDQSLDSVALAKAILDTNRQYLTEAEYAQMSKAALDFRAQIQKVAEQDRLKRLLMQEQDARVEQAGKRLKMEEERDEKANQLIKRSADLRREQNYEQAIEVLDQLLFMDPNNLAAQAMKETMEETIIQMNMKNLRRKQDLLAAEHSVDNLTATLPWTELMTYPTDWPQLTNQRLRSLGQGGGESEPNRRVAEILKQPIPIDFEDTRFENVIEYLRNITAVDMVVNWKVLEEAGMDKGTPLNLKLANVPADRALRMILEQAGGSLVPLGFNIDDGVVTISTVENLQKNTTILIYDIRDLLVQVPNFDEAPDFDLTAISQSSGGGGGGQNLFEDAEETVGLTREEVVQQIQTLIMDTVDSEGWKENSGDVSSMSELNGNLVINTTTPNHIAILSLMSQLRETRALQINVEARFLLVDQNYLEEVGVDVDLTITDPGGRFGPIVITQEHYDIADRINTTVSGSFGASDPSTVTGENFRRAMHVSGTFLNDVQVDFLIRATQANRHTIALSAPRVTFFNGQRAYVLVSTQLAYVSDLSPLVGTGSTAFDPTISVVSSGVILDIEGTVSSDRRYVTLTARPSLARVLRLRGIEISATTGGGFTPPPVVGAPVVPPPGLATGLIEAPELELTTIRTTVSVPDKGTLLMGGQRLVTDVEIEAGVPVFNKVPILNRFFTNRSTVKDERTLLILIKPTIIIQSEKEDELFPGLSQSPEIFGSGSN